MPCAKQHLWLLCTISLCNCDENNMFPIKYNELDLSNTVLYDYGEIENCLGEKHTATKKTTTMGMM